MKGIGLKAVGVAAPPVGPLGNLPFVPFDLSLATFTPGLAKRAPTSPIFSTAPIIQGRADGTGTPDVVSMPNGTLIAGSAFYSNFDPNQGTIIVRWIPEYSDPSIASGDHYFIACSFLNFYYDYDIGRYRYTIGGQSGYNTVAVTAGTPTWVCLSWDCKNTIDGTNYARISHDDIHSFGLTSSPTLSAPGSIYIGSTGSTKSISGILEGLTIFRRVLWDGSYGLNVGAGDEINLISAGADPTSFHGAWDVTACIPTNQTAGALVTGAGEAWSHPFGSNVITDAFLSHGYYGNQWALKFNGTSSFVDCGSDASLDDIPAGGGILQAEGWFRSDGSGNQWILSKGVYGIDGWVIRINSANSLMMSVRCNATIEATLATNINDKRWHHFVGHYNDTTKVAQGACDGRWGVATAAGAGAYVSDAARAFRIGRQSAGTDYYFTGSIGWINLHNDAHYTPGVDFVPPLAPPAADVEEWLMADGTGATAAAVVNAANNGTITAGTWEPQWYAKDTPVIPYSVVGSSTYRTNVGSGATIDNLADGAMTGRGWFRIPRTGTIQYLCVKGTPGTTGWYLRAAANGTLFFCVQAGGNVTVASTITYDDNRWHYVRWTFDDGGDRKIRLYVDNDAVRTSAAAANPVDLDAASDGYISFTNNCFQGAHGWIDWSNNIRDVTSVISRITPPTPDANTMAIWLANEGAGTALADTSGNGNNGTIANGTWNNKPEMALDNPGARAFAWGFGFGSDGVDDGIKQTWTGLTAGSRYILRAIGKSGSSGLAKPKVVVYDETNSAEISHLDGDEDRELVTAGDMSDATKFSAGAGWAIAGGVAHHDAGTASNLGQAAANQQNGGVYTGGLYKVTWTVLNWAAGTIAAYAGGSAFSDYVGADGTYTRIIRSAGSTNIGLAADAAFHGDVDNFSVTRVSEPNQPDMLIMSFELPTNARGAAADCTSFSVEPVNNGGAGMVYWDQIEILPNLLDNPSLDTGAVADPWIPYGETNAGVDAGDSERETALSHSSGGCLQINSGWVSTEYIYQNTTVVTGKYYAAGCWELGTGVSGEYVRFTDLGAKLVDQATLSSTFLERSYANYWTHKSKVTRATGIASQPRIYADTGANPKYIDDRYLYTLADITLTVTPASYANSLEGTGVRIDGLDAVTQPIGILQPTAGWFGWRTTFRHAAADFVKFGNATPSLCRIYGNANNYIYARELGANTIELGAILDGVPYSVTWTCTGLIAVGSTHRFDLLYTTSWIMLMFDLVPVAFSLTTSGFAVGPTLIYVGQNNSNVQQADAVFSAPT